MEQDNLNNQAENDHIYFSGNPQISRHFQEKDYSRPQIAFAFLSLILGYLFVNLILFGGLGVSATVFTLTAITACIFYFAFNKKEAKIPVLPLLLAVCFSLNFLFSSNGFIKFLCLLFIMITFLYGVFIYGENKSSKGFLNSLGVDLFKSIFMMPFSHMGDCFSAIRRGFKKTDIGKKFGFSLLGIALAFPVTVIIIALLSSADDAFSSLFSYLFSNIIGNIFTFVFQFILGLPAAVYLFGAFYASQTKANQELKDLKSMAQKTRAAPSIMMYMAVTPVCLVYVLFFVSQASYFLSAFQNIIPKNTTYSEYARRGFFELCAVAVINFIIILLLELLVKRKDNKKPAVLKGYIVTLSLFTLMLLSTAFSKMAMYINEFGLTPLRVYPSWFMCLLAIVFLLVIIKQFMSRLKAVKIFSVCFMILFVLLCFCDVDGLIAKYNIEQYEKGNLKHFKVEIMYKLSDSAVQYVIPLKDSKDKELADAVKNYLNDKEMEMNKRKNDWRSFNFSTLKAKKLLSGN